MQAVPKDLYDAASLDGATSFQQLRKITVPAIKPTILFTVIISTIGGMQVLAEPLLFGGGNLTGGSDRQYQTLALYLYEVGFNRFDFGYASAAAWMMFAIIVIAAIFNYFLTSRTRRS
jgi:cellobiose transport system permease protein